MGVLKNDKMKMRLKDLIYGLKLDSTGKYRNTKVTLEPEKMNLIQFKRTEVTALGKELLY